MGRGDENKIKILKSTFEKRTILEGSTRFQDRFNSLK